MQYVQLYTLSFLVPICSHIVAVKPIFKVNCRVIVCGIRLFADIAHCHGWN